MTFSLRVSEETLYVFSLFPGVCFIKELTCGNRPDNFFNVLLTVHLSIILVINKLIAQNLVL